MTCRKCSYEFCWLCKGDWKSHTSCAVWDPKVSKSDAAKEALAAQAAKNDLDKYMHHFARFENHAKSIKFAEKTRAATLERMESLQSMRGAGLQEVSFLLEAVNTVIKCKRILQWTYCFGYYLEAAGSKRALFESQQQQLEQFCDRLHEMTEKPLDSMLTQNARTDMISFTRLSEKYRVNVVDAIQSSQLFY